jgi:hypothetical protein
MEYMGLIVAFGALSVTMVGVLISCMFWMRGEANNLRLEAQADRRDILQLIRAIDKEIRDFHTRLCAIEERRK